jgi:hypothetical protein
MAKCDVCENPATDELMHGTINFCKDHFKEAKEMEKRTARALEEWEDYKEDQYFCNQKK